MVDATTHVAPTDPRRNNIGTLRLVGALAVLIGHSFVLSSDDGRTRDVVSNAIGDVTPFSLGLPGIGVAMFFAISGYLVAQSFVRRGSAVAYVEARLLRIYPALWLAIAVTIAVGAVVSTYSPDAFLQSQHTLDYAVGGASLLDLHFRLPGVFASNPNDAVNGSLWTLPVELRMYLFVGVVGTLGLLRRRLAFNLAAGALVAIAVAWPEGLPMLAERHHREIASFFLAGTALYVNREAVPLRFAGVIVVAALAAALSWTAAYPLAFALAFSYAVLWLGFSTRVRLPDLARRADLSYATYLYAFPATQLWVLALGPGSPWLVAALTVASVLPLAYTSWRLVEAPALRLKGRLARVGPRGSAVARGSAS